jgi:hypothetical protein
VFMPGVYASLVGGGYEEKTLHIIHVGIWKKEQIEEGEGGRGREDASEAYSQGCLA